MQKGFNQDLFIKWLQEGFDTTVFTIDMVLNILEYAYKHECVSKDMFCYFVADMIPEIDMLTVANFCEDGMLTTETLKALGRR